MHIIHFYAKTHECSLQDLSKSSSFALWSRLAFSTATLIYLALVPMSFFLLVESLPPVPSMTPLGLWVLMYHLV